MTNGDDHNALDLRYKELGLGTENNLIISRTCRRKGICCQINTNVNSVELIAKLL